MANRTDGNRNLIRLTSVSALALTSLGAMSLVDLAPADASSTNAKPKPVTQAQIDSYTAAHPDLAKALADTGVGESAKPDFGIGKPTIQVVGKPNSFPSDLNPSFTGLDVDTTISGVSEIGTCTTAGNPASCSPGPIPA